MRGRGGGVGRGVRGELARKVVKAGWELSYFLMLLKFSKRLVAKMYLMSGLLEETSDSKKERELADLFSLRLSVCLSCW